jgi:hypothetical protein
VNKTIIFIFLSFFFASSSAQEPIRYTTKQGLPSNHIYDMQQDKDGFMWFATNRGVVKFDGKTFKTFTSKDGLPNNDTWRLEPDLKGRMWYYAKSKYQGYIKNDSVYKFIVQDSLVVSPASWQKSKDSIGFFSVLGSTLLIDSIFKVKIINDKYDLEEIISKYNYNIITDGYAYNPFEKEYIIIKKDTILFLNKDLHLKDSIHHKTPTYKTSGYIKFSGILYYNTFFYTTDEGILFINHKTKKIKYYSFSSLIGDEEPKEIRANGLVNEIQISIRGHLFRFNYNYDLLQTIHHSKNLPNKNSFIDRDGNLWMSDITQGIVLIPQIRNITKTYLNAKKVQKIGVVNNQLFAGVDKDGFYQYYSNKDFFHKNENLKSKGKIYQIKEPDNFNNSYFISGKYSTAFKEGASSQVTFDSINNYDGYEIQYGFKDIIEHKNDIYGITASNILKHNFKTNKYTVSVIKAGLSQFEIFDNNIYVSGSDGLFLYNNDTLKKVSLPSEFIDTPINYLKAKDEILWIGTDGRGVVAYNKQEIYHINETDDLSILRIIKKDSILWLATQKGIKKVLINNNDISASFIIDSFYEEDGLLQNNVNDIYLENNFLYAATDSGLSKINLEDSIYKKLPEIYFTSVQDTLIITPDEKENISVSFASLQFTNQDHNVYEYRFLPIQKEWVLTTSNTLNFSHLSPRFYTLEIRATDQHKNRIQIRKHIQVLPFWWQTTFAKIVAGLLIVCFLFLILKIIQKRIRKVETEKAERDKRVAGLELQALRSQMNPHFVHNSLSAIQYYIQRNEVDLSEKYLTKFSKLIRLFFEYSRKQFLTIKEEVSLLENYLQIEKLRFEEKLSFTIYIDDKIEEEVQKLPSMMLQPIVENAVNHGLFHKKENGNVDIRFQYVDESTFRVIIEDDGIGIHKAKELYKNSTNNNQDRSSNVLEERLELFNYNKDWDIEYTIKDKSDILDSNENNVNSTGTIVSLLFKSNM